MSRETEMKANEVPWRHYPHVDSALEMETPAVLGRMEKTCRELDRLSRAGTERERERARVALVAYRRALELYHQLVNLRDEVLQAASNTSHGTAITE
jgi:hypothetical protein